MSTYTPRPVPDPEIDFDACIEAICANVVDEIRRDVPDTLPSMERVRRLMLRSMARLQSHLDGPWFPPFLIDQEMESLVHLIGAYSALRECDPSNPDPLTRPWR